MNGPLNPALKARNSAFFSRSASFRRKTGHIRTRKIQRKFRVRSWQIVMFFIFLFGLFYTAHRVYIFLISWEELKIRVVDVTCRKPEIRGQVIDRLNTLTYGNLLLFHSSSVRHSLASIPGIKDLRIKKIIPPALKIEIVERLPVAVVSRRGYFLVDADGVILEAVSPEDRPDLPVLLDQEGFETFHEEKLALAWSCLSSFDPQTRSKIDVIDLTNPFNLRIKFERSPVWLLIGSDRFTEKYQNYLKSKTLWQTLGPLDYVDLRFDDRFYVKKGTPDTDPSIQPKEAY